jgi:hypothetical protein
MTEITNLPDYYAALAERAGRVRAAVFANVQIVARGHRHIEDFTIWRQILEKRTEVVSLTYAIQELQTGVYAAISGLYRPAYVSLRLALELTLGTVFFSANRLNLEEWRSGVGDLHWATVTDANNGVLSARYVKAFFPELGSLTDAQTLASSVYRELSEFVHGNLHTLLSTPESVVFDPKLHNRYFELLTEVSYLGNLALVLRYLCELDKDSLARVEPHLLEQLGHIGPIRDVFQEASGRSL